MEIMTVGLQTIGLHMKRYLLLALLLTIELMLRAIDFALSFIKEEKR